MELSLCHQERRHLEKAGSLLVALLGAGTSGFARLCPEVLVCGVTVPSLAWVRGGARSAESRAVGLLGGGRSLLVWVPQSSHPGKAQEREGQLEG